MTMTPDDERQLTRTLDGLASALHELASITKTIAERLLELERRADELEKRRP